MQRVIVTLCIISIPFFQNIIELQNNLEITAKKLGSYFDFLYLCNQN